MNNCYHLGLLHLTHLLVGVDGDVNETEIRALNEIKQKEKIADDIFNGFQDSIKHSRERDIYSRGIEFIKQCTLEEKLKTFVTLYKISEVDGRVHVKEVKLLLYSIEEAGIEFDDVVNAAKLSQDIL